MRVLFLGSPGTGHLLPLIPLATAFRDRGHVIAFATLDGGEAVTTLGLPHLPIQPGLDWRRELRRLGAQRHPDLLARTVATNSADRAAFVPLAAQVNLEALPATIETARAWRPDLVVYEYLYPAALVAAAELGVPAIQHELGFTRTAPLRALMLAELGHPTLSPAATLEIAPRGMIPGPDYGRPLRPVPVDTPGDLPAPSDRPRIAVTLGTVPPKVDGLTRLDRVVAAAAELDAELILVMGRMDISDLGPLPPNVRPTGWLPWHRLLETSAAAIHHGGSGTALAALGAGVPQLVLPDGSDRFITAEAVHARGAGVQAAADDITPDLLQHLLGDPGLRAAAREVEAEIAAMPGPGEVAAALA
ncbi:glycosyltransferase [Crossiella sp. CA-258035]|uniref:glycosyltransferase n=1 Tax=Crossiella sp. CA-258035 TaxID=2981138 RepID=UPI0024BD2384|nr:glycosyltransferase [Crossiella sp. CA-258035]WHT23015.1 glycosyltransferase [Crossiella sp. CA-258035]